jgi:hypothetical protein
MADEGGGAPLLLNLPYVSVFCLPCLPARQASTFPIIRKLATGMIADNEIFN